MYRECPICNCLNGKKLGNLEYVLFDDNPLSNEYNVVACENCGFVLCDTQTSQNDYDNFYEKYFYSSAYVNREINDDELQYVTDTIQRIQPYIKDLYLNIFDIGCGNGALLKKLKLFGYKNLYGIDISKSCVNILKNEGINANNGSVTNIPFKDTKADVIILSHVIEHIVDMKSALKFIKNKLTNDGLIYVEVPNANEYDIFENCSPIRYFYLQHIAHFDSFHLSNLFKANGYTELKNGISYRKEGNLVMPCVWGIFHKNYNHEMMNQSNNNETINQNFYLSDKIKKWFNDINLDTNNILSNLVSSKKVIYIWGLGIHMSMMLAMSPLKNCKIKYFVDSDERNQKRTINGYKIHPTSILKNAKENDVIIIGAPTHAKEMCNHLVDTLKFEGKIIIMDFGNIYIYQNEMLNKMKC